MCESLVTARARVEEELLRARLPTVVNGAAGHHWSSLVIIGHHWSMAPPIIIGQLWSALVIMGHHGSSWVIIGQWRRRSSL
eukprot:4048471-Prymnesium_polylepis.1